VGVVGMIPAMATSSTTPTMAEQVVPDELWSAIQPLLPAKPLHPKGGRPWIQDRAVLGGIIYVLRAGVTWRLLPAKELGCGSGVTCCDPGPRSTA
jgi:transposase